MLSAKSRFLILALLLSLAGAAQYVQPMNYKDYSVRDQLNLGSGTTKFTEASAYLEIGDPLYSRKGLLFPRGNKDSISNPVRGLVIFDLPTARLQFYNGTSWAPVGSTSSGVIGGGTSNKLARWVSGSSLGASSVADDGTSAAIGGAVATGYKLKVYGNVNIDGTLTSSSLAHTGTVDYNLVVDAQGNFKAVQLGLNNWGAFTGNINSQTDLISKFNTYQLALSAASVTDYRRGDNTAADFKTDVYNFSKDSFLLRSQGLSAATIYDFTPVGRSLYTGGAGINVNQATGVITNTGTGGVGGGSFDTTQLNLPARFGLYQPLLSSGSTTQYRRGDNSLATLNKAAVGLSNVDNTTDLGKPISTATQSALNAKQDVLTAGTNISISGGVINAAGGAGGTPTIAPARIYGRYSNTTGAGQEIKIGDNLTLSGDTLKATGGTTWTAKALGITGSGDKTSSLQTAINSSAVKGIWLEENQAYTLNSTITVPQGKFLRFDNGARMIGSGGISGGLVIADPTQDIFDTTLTVTNLSNTTIWVEWFGAKGEYQANVTNGYDNYAALVKALGAGRVGSNVRIGAIPQRTFSGDNPSGLFFYVSRQLQFTRTIDLAGAGSNSTVIIAALGMKVNPGVNGCRIKGFTLQPTANRTSSGYNSFTQNGFDVKGAQNSFEDITVQGYNGNGFYNVGDVNGGSNANLNRYLLCNANTNGNSGFYFQGGDANSCVIEQCSGVGNARWNAWDNSFLGNDWRAFHAATAASIHPSQRSICYYNGLSYWALQDNVGIEPTVTPGWQNYWQQRVIFSVNLVTWTSSAQFYTGGGYYVSSAAAQSSFTNCYVEFDQLELINNDRSDITGGNLANFGRTTGGIGTTAGYKTMLKMQVQNPSNGYSVQLNSLDGSVGWDDNQTNSLKMYGSAGGFLWKYNVLDASVNEGMVMSNSYFVGSSNNGNAPTHFFKDGFSLGLNGAFPAKRFVGYVNTAPNDGFYHEAGEWAPYYGTNLNILGWRCTASGTPGTWTMKTSIDLSSIPEFANSGDAIAGGLQEGDLYRTGVYVKSVVSIKSWINTVSGIVGYRNDHNGRIGNVITVGPTNVTVKELGRWVVAGNASTHTISIVDTLDNLIVSANLNTAGKPAGAIAYVSCAPTVLLAYKSYFIGSEEVNNSDQWVNGATLATSTDIKLTGGGYSTSGGLVYGFGPGNIGSPVSFRYTGGTAIDAPAYVLPAMSSSLLGGAKKGGTLTIDGSGTLDVDTATGKIATQTMLTAAGAISASISTSNTTPTTIYTFDASQTGYTYNVLYTVVASETDGDIASFNVSATIVNNAGTVTVRTPVVYATSADTGFAGTLPTPTISGTNVLIKVTGSGVGTGWAIRLQKPISVISPN